MLLLSNLRLRALIAFVFFVAPGAIMAAPSQATCDQIFLQYGVAGVGCPSAEMWRVNPSGATPGTPAGTVSDWQRESNVFFLAGGSQLDHQALAQISQLALILETPLMKGACLQLVGHSDSVGGAAANQRLSLRRAERVAQALTAMLRDPDRIQEVSGKGEEEPMLGFDPRAAENRRVGIWARTCP